MDNVHGNCNYLKLNALFLTPERRSKNSSPCRNQDYRSLVFFYFLFYSTSLIGLCLFFCLVNQRRKGDTPNNLTFDDEAVYSNKSVHKTIAIDYNYVHVSPFSIFYLYSPFFAFIQFIPKIIMGKKCTVKCYR